MTKIPEVSNQVWKELYALADEFQKLEPWELLDDDELFGIQNPVTGEMGYACVLGAMGELFALCVYRGTEGFDIHQRIQRNEIDWDNGDFLTIQNCLMAEWADREDLKKEDLEIIKNLGLQYRGAASWPLFRSHLPGHLPWHITETEAQFLTFALRCASDMVKKVGNKEIDIQSIPNQLPCYFSKGKDGSTTSDFEIRWESHPIHRPEPAPPIALDVIKLKEIQSKSFSRSSAWEADISPAPITISDRNSPYIPFSSLIVHQESGFVFNAGMTHPEEDKAQTLCNMILEAIKKSESLPDIIYVKDDKMAASLAPLGKILGIKIMAGKKLNSVIQAKRGMESFFGKQQKKETSISPDPRALEKHTFNLSRKTEEKDIQSKEELEQCLMEMERKGEMDSSPAPKNAWEVAQNLIYAAFEETNPTRRVEIAQRALQISLDCADAYIILAEETARNLEEARDLYQKAVEAGERSLGKKFFDENVGHFWGMVESRSYMRARAELASCFWHLENHETALQHYSDLLRLNPNDNQGIRYTLIACLGELGKFKEVDKILSMKEYEDDCELEWLLMKVLTAFMLKGPSPEAETALKEALDENKYFPDYLLMKKRLPRQLPETYKFGGEDEAIIGAAGVFFAWNKSPSALKWLAGEMAKLTPHKTGRNEPCPCGSEKKFKKCCG